MQALTFQNDSSLTRGQVISNYQSLPRRSCKLSNIREAVKAWEKATPGAAQEIISQLVAKEWLRRGGKGLLLAGSAHNTKQNFFRMINKPGPKNDKSLTALLSVIVDVMGNHNEVIARQFGLITGKTEAELIANNIKECAELQQVKMLGAPPKVILKEGREALESVLHLLPVDSWGPLLAGLMSMVPGAL